MKDQQGHNYFFAIPRLPWKEDKMAIISQELAEQLEKFEERIAALESALSALQKQEEAGNEEEKESIAEG